MPKGREVLLNKPLPNPSNESEQVLLEKARGLGGANWWCVTSRFTTSFPKHFSLPLRENRSVASSLIPKYNNILINRCRQAERIY